jgi:hypothetical protein
MFEPQRKDRVRAFRLQQDHLGLFVGSRPMLDTTRHDDKLAWLSSTNSVSKLDAKATSADQKHLFQVSVVGHFWLQKRPLRNL